MARLYVFAEGQTEQTFATTVLQPHLAGLGVYLTTILVKSGGGKGRTYRGGGRSYPVMRDDLQRLMLQQKGGDVYFTTMLDLYALYSDFPGSQQARKLQPYDRVAFLERSFHEDLGGDRRLIPYIPLHEFEAYLFCDLRAFESMYPNKGVAIEKLLKIAAEFASPEFINDGPQSAPSKRIIQWIPEYQGGKAVDGPLIAATIGLEAIRARCPHFHEWVTRLEKLS